MCIAFSPDSHLVAFGCSDCTVKTIDIRAGKVLCSDLNGNPHNTSLVSYSVNGLLIVAGSYSNLYVLDAYTLALKSILDLGKDTCWFNVFLKNRDQVFCVANSGTIRIWDLLTGCFEEFHLCSKLKTAYLCYSEFSSIVAIVERSGSAYFWDVKSKTRLTKCKLSTDSFSSCCFSPTSNRLTVVSDKVIEYSYEM
jgi:WD40 repeat protein